MANDKRDDEFKSIFGFVPGRGAVLNVAEIGRDLMVTWTNMYDPPTLDDATRERLMDFFGAPHVGFDLSSLSQSGCESCDWGSQYGHEITVRGATRNQDYRCAFGRD